MLDHSFVSVDGRQSLGDMLLAAVPDANLLRKTDWPGN